MKKDEKKETPKDAVKEKEKEKATVRTLLSVSTEEVLIPVVTNSQHQIVLLRLKLRKTFRNLRFRRNLAFCASGWIRKLSFRSATAVVFQFMLVSTDFLIRFGSKLTKVHLFYSSLLRNSWRNFFWEMAMRLVPASIEWEINHRCTSENFAIKDFTDAIQIESGLHPLSCSSTNRRIGTADSTRMPQADRR